MVNTIRPIMPEPDNINPLDNKMTSAGKVTPDKAMESFQNMLKDALKEINEKQLDKNDAINKFATGETSNISEVISAVREADLSFKMLVQIRDKLVSAYDEIMRLRI